MGARFYDPGLGAFTQLDTVIGSAENPISMNRYLYAGANPWTLVDPTGHSFCTPSNWPNCDGFQKGGWQGPKPSPPPDAGSGGGGSNPPEEHPSDPPYGPGPSGSPTTTTTGEQEAGGSIPPMNADRWWTPRDMCQGAGGRFVPERAERRTGEVIPSRCAPAATKPGGAGDGGREGRGGRFGGGSSAGGGAAGGYFGSAGEAPPDLKEKLEWVYITCRIAAAWGNSGCLESRLGESQAALARELFEPPDACETMRICAVGIVIVPGGGGARSPKTTKPPNLPAWKKVSIDMPHVAERHIEGGPLARDPRGVFPSYMSKAEIEYAIRQAYRVASRLQTVGNQVRVRGSYQSLTIEMWVNTETNIITTGYPLY